MKKFLIAVMMGSLFFSCVSKKEYLQLQESEQKYFNAAKNCKEELENLRNTASNLNKEKMALESRITDLLGDSTSLASQLGTLNMENESLAKENEAIKKRLNNLKDEDEVRTLLADIQSLRNRLFAKEDSLNQIMNQLNEKERLLDEQNSNLKEQQALLEKQNAQLIELNRIISEKENALNLLKEKVSNALAGFEGNGLEVTNKNGKIYVSLEEKLLFKSGRWDVDPKGISALKNLSVVLSENKDIKIEVEGHTDDVRYAGSGNVTDNWDLSTKRATSIVRIILENKDIDPNRITASGRGEYVPLDMDKTPEARQKNRRTEIILSPNLDEILNLLNQ